MSWNEWKINFTIFIFLVMVDFVHKIHQQIDLKNETIHWKHFFWLRARPLKPPTGVAPCTPHAFRLRTLAWLISIWIRFAKTSVNVSFRFAKISQPSSCYTAKMWSAASPRLTAYMWTQKRFLVALHCDACDFVTPWLVTPRLVTSRLVV